VVRRPRRLEGHALDELRRDLVQHAYGLGEAVLYVAVAVEELGYWMVGGLVGFWWGGGKRGLWTNARCG
jgi:hypothetical protein